MSFLQNPLVTLIDFSPSARGSPISALPNVGPHPVVEYYGNPLTVRIDFAPISHGPAVDVSPAQYRVILAHWINDVYYVEGSIISESGITPGQLPEGWVPTLAVDPLNSDAVTQFYNAGPRDLHTAPSNDLDYYGSTLGFKVQPVTFWTQVPGTNTFVLTGLGAGLPPRT